MGIMLRPGTYYIGDPAYITKGNEGWQWIEKMWDALYATKDKYIFTVIDGVEIFVGRTYGGDGIFGEFFVDSGAIAIINIDYLKDDPRFKYIEDGIKGTKFITLDNDTLTEYHNGEFIINGILTINTDI